MTPRYRERRIFPATLIGEMPTPATRYTAVASQRQRWLESQATVTSRVNFTSSNIFHHICPINFYFQHLNRHVIPLLLCYRGKFQLAGDDSMGRQVCIALLCDIGRLFGIATPRL